MKQKIFTLLMMLALMVVAGSAFGQGSNTSPYRGQSYSYSLSGISVVNASSVVVTYEGTGATIDGTLPTIANLPDAASDQTINFTVPYGAGATNGDLRVTITDLTTNCSNWIQIAITPTNPPTLALAVTSNPVNATEICQAEHTAPGNNVASRATIAGSPLTNTITFTVTPTRSPSTTFLAGESYSFNFDLNDYVYGATVISLTRTSGNGTATANGSGISVSGATDTQQFTATFLTTTGVANENIIGSASSSIFTVSGSGAGTYNVTPLPASSTVVVKAVPTISGTIN